MWVSVWLVGGWQDLGLWGLAWAALVLNGLFFPAASVYMLWAFATTARALRGRGHNNNTWPRPAACMHDCPRQTDRQTDSQQSRGASPA